MSSRLEPRGVLGRPLRVLMLAPTSFFADYGCHVRILEEARVLQQRGHQVAVCTYHSGRDVPDVRILRTMSIPWRRGYEVGSSRHKVAFDLLLSLRSLRAMWQVRPDVIHAHLHEGALIGTVLSRLWRVPLVFDYQGSMTSEMVDHRFLQRDSPWFARLRWLEERIDRWAPRIVTSSAHSAARLSQALGDGRVACVPDCVNTQAFCPPTAEERARLRARWGFLPEHVVVVYLGKLAPYQGTDLLLQAAARLCRRPEVRFLVGGYPFVDRYQELAASLGIAERVRLPGKVPYEEAPAFLSAGDIAVSPKLSETEGAGKLLNYMAMGLPTVTFDTPVSREFLGDWGRYARPGCPEDLARHIEALVEDGGARCALGAALRRRARGVFAWERAGEAIEEVYAALLSGRRALR